MDKILKGVMHFHSTIKPDMMPLFAKLVKEGQSPRALFITCADSRIDPSLITSTDPGDLFILRNIGNLVPAYEEVLNGRADDSVGAAVEYSLTALNIKNIIVCGHSDCGAMKAVQKYRELPTDSLVRSWLCHAEPSLERLQEGRALDPALSSQDQLAQLNALQQVSNLKGYPIVQERLEAGELVIHPWYLDILRAEIDVFHPGRNRFVRADEDTVEEIHFLSHVFRRSPEVKSGLDQAQGI